MKKIFFLAALAALASLSACKPKAPTANLKSDVDTVSYEIGMANTQGIEYYFRQMGIDSAHIQDFIKGLQEGVANSSDPKKKAYYLGVMMGQNLEGQMFPAMEQRVFAGDSTQHLSMKNFVAGFIAGIKGDSTLTVDGRAITPERAGEDANRRMESLLSSVLEKRFPEQKAAAEAYMKEVGKNKELKALSDGVYYKVITEGTGEKPALSSTVQVVYEGRLTNDSVFDSSERLQPGKPVEMPVSGVIKGLQAALQQMPVGSIWEIYIPYNQGYGAAGSGPIPQFANLIFKVDLRGIKENKPAAEQPVDIVGAENVAQ